MEDATGHSPNPFEAVNSRLTLAYEFARDGDDFGWLSAAFATPDFSGRNGTWVQWQSVVELAAGFRRYPMSEESPAEADWGFGGAGGYVSVTRIRIAPRGPLGGLIASVRLANQYDPEDCAAVRFETDYPSLARFAEELEAVMRREAESATLAGDRRPDA